MYADEVSVLAHTLALAAYRELQWLMSLPLPAPKCEQCPYDHTMCGKGCNGEPPELPELPAQGPPE